LADAQVLNRGDKSEKSDNWLLECSLALCRWAAVLAKTSSTQATSKRSTTSTGS
jgi:hypothetical protein